MQMKPITKLFKFVTFVNMWEYIIYIYIYVCVCVCVCVCVYVFGLTIKVKFSL